MTARQGIGESHRSKVCSADASGPYIHNDDDKPGHGTDQQCVDEGPQHGDHALLYWLIGARCRMRNRRASEPGLVGKNPPGNAKAQSRPNSRSGKTSCRSSGCQSAADNGVNRTRHFGYIQRNDNHRHQYVSNSHKRHQPTRDHSNTTDSAEYNRCN